MFGETTISYVMIWNHPIETTIYKQMFQVPGRTITPMAENCMGLKWDEISSYLHRGRLQFDPPLFGPGCFLGTHLVKLNFGVGLP